MISFRDIAHCNSDCSKHSCYRHLSNIPQDDDGNFQTGGVPIAVADMSGSCDDYQLPKDGYEQG